MTNEMNLRSGWREHFKNLLNIGCNEGVIAKCAWVDSLRRNRYFGDEVMQEGGNRQNDKSEQMELLVK